MGKLARVNIGYIMRYDLHFKCKHYYNLATEAPGGLGDYRLMFMPASAHCRFISPSHVTCPPPYLNMYERVLIIQNINNNLASARNQNHDIYNITVRFWRTRACHHIHISKAVIPNYCRKEPSETSHPFRMEP